MKKKIFYYTTLLLVTLMLGVCTFSNYTYSKFDSENILENITLLSSSTYNGRLSGTAENEKVAEYIETSFKENNLQPLDKDYKENFTLNCPIKDTSDPYLYISKNGSIVTTLKYGEDYKEDGINFNKNTITFDKNDILKINTFTIQVQNSEGKFLFFNPEKDNLSFRSSFSDDFNFDCVIMITSKAYGELIRSLNENCEVSVHVPFSNEKKTISNVVGVLEGKNNSLPPLVLTAHFDHLGKDGDDNLYGGALDNASGISFLLELQKTFSSLGKPERDIIFVALNAEEFGLKGSEVFAKTHLERLKDAEIINFDMVGSDNYPITIMLPSCMENKPCTLYDEIVKICDSNDVKTNVEYKDSSDHASFGNEGLNAVTISHSDVRFIHTPEDKIDNISAKAIDSVYNIVYEKVTSSSYSNMTLIIHNNYVLIFLLVTLLLLISIPALRKIKKSNE